jgi:hypothetical protein
LITTAPAPLDRALREDVHFEGGRVPRKTPERREL